MFVGTNNLILNEETVIAAIEEYLNRRVSGPSQHLRVYDMNYVFKDNTYNVDVVPKSEDN